MRGGIYQPPSRSAGKGKGGVGGGSSSGFRDSGGTGSVFRDGIKAGPGGVMPRSSSKKVGSGGGGGKGRRGSKGGGDGESRPGDWRCPECGANVFASKNECFKCGAKKPAGGRLGSGATAAPRGGSKVTPVKAKAPPPPVRTYTEDRPKITYTKEVLNSMKELAAGKTPRNGPWLVGGTKRPEDLAKEREEERRRRRGVTGDEKDDWRGDKKGRRDKGGRRHKGPAGPAPLSQRPLAAAGGEEYEKEARSVLNKLTPDNYDRLLPKLVKTSALGGRKGFEALVNLVFV